MQTPESALCFSMTLCLGSEISTARKSQCNIFVSFTVRLHPLSEREYRKNEQTEIPDILNNLPCFLPGVLSLSPQKKDEIFMKISLPLYDSGTLKYV